MSDQLLDQISRDLRPSRKGFVLRRLGLGLLLGVLVSTMLVGGVLGFRPDMALALGSSMFWVKIGYTLGLSVVGVWCVERLSRPGATVSRRLPWLAVPPLAIIGLAAVQLALASPERRPNLVMGESAAVCPGLIFLASLPILLGLMWAMRRLAPTRLRMAGGIAGITAGGLGASVYAMHCPEAGAPFIALWYSGGVLAAGAAGAALGARALRW